MISPPTVLMVSPQCTEHPPVYCTDIMQDDHSFSHFKNYSFSHFVNYTVFSLCKIQSSLFHNMQFLLVCFANYSIYSVTKQSLPLFANYNCFIFCLKIQFCSFCKVQFFSFSKIRFSLFPKKTFLLVSQIEVFSMSQNIVRIPVEDWHLIYTTFRKVRSTYLSSDGTNE